MTNTTINIIRGDTHADIEIEHLTSTERRRYLHHHSKDALLRWLDVACDALARAEPEMRTSATGLKRASEIILQQEKELRDLNSRYALLDFHHTRLLRSLDASKECLDIAAPPPPRAENASQTAAVL